ncbi:MAG: hypothetical protein LIP77_09345, partial [Planctomycetes bacterium]|nr:hypothetical protein [Planctomycetota bacterium]
MDISSGAIRSRRGSALLLIAYLGTVLTAIVGVHFYRTTLTASRMSQTLENDDGAQAAAEFALEMAIAFLSDMEYSVSSEGERVSVVADWVDKNPYSLSDGTAEHTERRIGGVIGDYEYRVM